MLRFLLVLFIFIIAGCSSKPNVNQDLSKGFLITPEMSMSETLSIMGQPIKSEFYQGVTEWHYCLTRRRLCEYLVIYFSDNKMVAKKNYTVTIKDTNGVGGSCEAFVKQGNYFEPSEVKEYRVKFNTI